VDSSTFCFLGDYCDRGPNTKGVLDWLVDFKNERLHDPTKGDVHFVCGNHDFGMASFLGSLPIDGKSPIDLDKTRKPDYTDGYWKHDVEGGMHYQGRRWGGSHIYQAQQTFESYHVKFDRHSRSARDELVAAVPEAHKDFLSSLEWVVDFPVSFEPGRVVCVHAGLEKKHAEEQIEALAKRDLSKSILLENRDPGRFSAFSGRRNVLDMPRELKGKALLISGHHGFNRIKKDRIVLDLSGGRPTLKTPLQAMILPERTIISCSTNEPNKQAISDKEQKNLELMQKYKPEEITKIIKDAILTTMKSHIITAWEVVLISEVTSEVEGQYKFVPSIEDIKNALASLANENKLESLVEFDVYSEKRKILYKNVE